MNHLLIQLIQHFFMTQNHQIESLFQLTLMT